MKNILVQDTDKDVLEVLTLALEHEGYHVLATIAYTNLLKQIDQFRPHVVMLDYKLTGEESIAAYKLIRDKYPYLPVLAISCNSNIHIEYSSAGFDGYMEKTFDLDNMYAILRKHMPKQDSA
ncbi:MAG TPA: hypothetical protein DIT07_11005 [Sphingobacteriaceae bacterium]|nr:hypothetical protein [Sphingobacteriaceae bacterium]